MTTPPRCSQDSAELSRLASYVNELRRRFDESFQTASLKDSALAARADSVKVHLRPPITFCTALTSSAATQELELDSLKLAEGDSPLSQTIQVLKSRLAGTVDRLDEVVAQRKTLEQIAKRLREDQTGLDPQV